MIDYEETRIEISPPLEKKKRPAIPMNMVRQWNLKPGGKLDWSWEVVIGEMDIVVRRKKS